MTFEFIVKIQGDKHQLHFALFMKGDKTTSVILMEKYCFRQRRSFYLITFVFKTFFFFRKYDDMLSLYFFMKKNKRLLRIIFLTWTFGHYTNLISQGHFFFYFQVVQKLHDDVWFKRRRRFLTKSRDFQGKYCIKETSDSFSIKRLKVPESKFKVLLKIFNFSSPLTRPVSS